MLNHYPVTLAEAKMQCRVDGSFEDAYLSTLIAAATAKAENETGLTLVDAIEPIPADLKMGILMLIGLWYDTRSGATDREMFTIPHGVDLFAKHRTMLGF